MEATKKLSNLQLELLRVFSFDLEDKQILEIREILANYFAKKATQEMDKLWEEKEWDEKKINEWSSDHMRTRYDQE